MTDTIWQQFLNLIRQECGSRVVETWFKAIKLHSWNSVEKTVLLVVPNNFVKEWVQKNYLTLLQEHIGRLLHLDMPRVCFVEQENEKNVESIAASSLIIPARIAQKAALVPAHHGKQMAENSYLFDTFVVGPSNSLAFAAAQAISERPGKLYNPLFIYGKSGLGKTHLLRAISNHVTNSDKKLVVLYQTADRFVTEFISAIRFNKVSKFKEKYQTVDVLLIDDIQFISNKEQTQEVLFHIFNMLYESYKQIVFSSDTFPLDMNGVAERLQSRFACGLVTDLYVPSLETKIAILTKKALVHGYELPEDVAHYIALQPVANVRELEGMLVRVIAFASLMQQKITLTLVQTVLQRTVHAGPSGDGIGFNPILKIISSYYNCSLEQLQSKGREKDIVEARQVAMFLMKQTTGKSLRAIGDFLGGRDHSTVMHGLEKIEDLMARSTSFKSRIDLMEMEIRRVYGSGMPAL